MTDTPHSPLPPETPNPAPMPDDRRDEKDVFSAPQADSRSDTPDSTDLPECPVTPVDTPSPDAVAYPGSCEPVLSFDTDTTETPAFPDATPAPSPPPPQSPGRLQLLWGTAAAAIARWWNSPTPWGIRAARLWRRARWILALPLLYYLLLFFQTAIPRIPHPFELEWFEGHLALQAARVVEGLPQYPSPDSGWATFSYPPVYFWATSVLFRVFDFHLMWGRWVSFFSTLLAALGAAMIIYDHTRKRPAAALGGLMLFAYFKPSGFWFDLFRVDMIAQALLAWGVYFGLKRRGRPWHVVVGVVLCILAPLAKQTVAPVSAVVIAVSLIRYWKAGRYLLLFAVIALFNIVALYGSVPKEKKEQWTWIYKYLVENPQRHPFYWNRVHPEGIDHKILPAQLRKAPMHTVRDYVQRFRAKPPEVWTVFYRFLVVPVGFAVLWALLSLLRWKRMRGGFWLLFAAMLLYGSLASFAMIGGFINNFIPGFAGICILFGLAVGGIERLLPRRWMRAVLDAVVLAALIIGFYLPAGLRYVPAQQQPHPASAERGRELVQWIVAQADPIYIPHHEYINRLAGKPTGYGIEAVRDLNYCGIPVPPALLSRLQSRHYRYIVLDAEIEHEWLPGQVIEILKKQYRRVGTVVNFKDFRELQPVTGAPMRPRLLFERVESDTLPAS